MILALVMSVMAADAVEPSGETAERSGFSSGSSNSGGKKNNNGNGNNNNNGLDDWGGKVFKTFKIGSWKFRPYIQPGGGVQIGSSNSGATTSVTAGANVGLKHWHKPWAGDALVGASFSTGSSQSGFEAHIGDTIGARMDMWGLNIGLTGTYDSYTTNGTSLKPSFGLDIPVQLVVGPRTIYGFAGLTPTFQSNPARHLSDSFAGNVKVCESGAVGANCKGKSHQEFFIGDEFSWTVGVGLKTKSIIGQLGVVHELNVSGSYWTPVVTLGWAG